MADFAQRETVFDLKQMLGEQSGGRTFKAFLMLAARTNLKACFFGLFYVPLLVTVGLLVMYAINAVTSKAMNLSDFQETYAGYLPLAVPVNPNVILDPNMQSSALLGSLWCEEIHQTDWEVTPVFPQDVQTTI